MQRLLVATRNAHKTREIREMLGADFDVCDLTTVPAPEVEETGATFAENATLKAVSSSAVFDGLVLADDSGLEVDALGGAPGVRSARYAGEPCDDRRNCEKLLRELEKAGATAKRTARFRCAMALASKGEVAAVFEGAVEGRIFHDMRGDGGFGYDPLFVPEGYGASFAELPAEVKNSVSHRARALAKVREFLDTLRPAATAAPRAPC